jgi:NAD(P)-dependent dehydrogenase (short-subunit alcohol dehydrogenase family)
MTGRLDSKVAIVTGAAQGIGRVYAGTLAAEGALVVVADIKEELAHEVARDISAAGGRAMACQVDVADEQSVEAMVKFATESFGGLDCLVNNAALYEGLSRLDPLDISAEDWDRVMAVNQRGVFLCIKHAVSALRARGGGRIVNQSSIGAWMGAAMMHYSVAKAGVIALTRLFAQTLGADGITVNAIAPGQINTKATLDHLPAEASQAMIQMQSIKRIGTPEDLAGAVVFLCSDESAFITGQTLVIDGGFLKL